MKIEIRKWEILILYPALAMLMGWAFVMTMISMWNDDGTHGFVKLLIIVVLTLAAKLTIPIAWETFRSSFRIIRE